MNAANSKSGVQKKRIPKFDGRPMLWWHEDGVEFGFEIRYGSGEFHKLEVYCRDKHEWTIHEGEMTPRECVEICNDIFCGYL